MISLFTKHLIRVKRGRYNTETCIPHVSRPEVVLDGDKILFMDGNFSGGERRETSLLIIFVLVICYTIWYHIRDLFIVLFIVR